MRLRWASPLSRLRDRRERCVNRGDLKSGGLISEGIRAVPRGSEWSGWLEKFRDRVGGAR